MRVKNIMDSKTNECSANSSNSIQIIDPKDKGLIHDNNITSTTEVQKVADSMKAVNQKEICEEGNGVNSGGISSVQKIKESGDFAVPKEKFAKTKISNKRVNIVDDESSDCRRSKRFKKNENSEINETNEIHISKTVKKDCAVVLTCSNGGFVGNNRPVNESGQPCQKVSPKSSSFQQNKAAVGVASEDTLKKTLNENNLKENVPSNSLLTNRTSVGSNNATTSKNVDKLSLQTPKSFVQVSFPSMSVSSEVSKKTSSVHHVAKGSHIFFCCYFIWFKIFN